MKQESSFAEKCYELLELIPEGKVTTYAEMARALNTRAWRAVGSAMAKNTRLVKIPCHRVVRSDGNIGQYALGTEKKSALLSSEGIDVVNGRIKNLEKYMFHFEC